MATPIYRQIMDQVAVAVTGGALQAGTKMPSVRAVAEALLINPNTVARAYGDLAQAGVLETQPGRGVFVAQAAAASHRRYSDAERANRLRQAAARFIREVALLGFRNAELLREVDRALKALEQSDSAPAAYDIPGESLDPATPTDGNPAHAV